MSDKKPGRRILVGLDASRISAEVQKAAAQIASFLKAELNALFVEDINLIHLAQLPFTQEIRTLTNKPAPLDVEEVQKRLQRQAALIRYELEQTATESNLEWTFRVVRGLVTQELLRAAQDADLLILGRLSRQHTLHKRIGSTAMTAVHQASGSVLIVTPEIDFTRPVLLIYDGSAAANRALILAMALAQISQQMQIILNAESESEVIQYKNTIAATLNGSKIYYAYNPIYPSKKDDLAAITNEVRPGIIVYGHGRQEVWPEEIERLLQTTNYPFLVVHAN